MADSKIVITAGLSIPESVNTIENDLKKVSNELDAKQALKITCHIDTKNIQHLQSQLNSLSKGLKINVGGIESGKIDNKSITNVANSFNEANNKALVLKKTLADLEDRFTEPFNAVFDTDGLINAERTMSVIQSRLSSLGTVTVEGKYNEQNATDSINRVIATIKATSGEVRTLNFLLDETDDKFKLLNSSYSDKGVGKVQQDLARLSKELANFEASHKSIESGLVEPLTAARNAIIDLDAGVGSVESAQKALDSLKTAAAEIGVNLKTTGSSFNIFDNASNKAKNFDNEIKTLELDISNLNQGSNKTNLAESLDNAKEKAQQLQNIEDQLGKGVEWSKSYKEVSELLQKITNDLKVVQGEEKKAFRDDVKLANFSNRIKRLSADMNAYASANQRAVDSTKQMTSGISFADEWTRLSTEMAKGANLSDIELKNLTTDMAVFKKEAKAAGLEGETAFQKFANAFKLVSTYISANQIINMVTRQIRSAVTELQTVDERLTEISKTSDRTNESLRNLGNTAFDTASKYGRTASDYLLGVQEMSRAGFGEVESENLAELSILAQAAGDMTAEMANEYLIATNAAYKLDGSVEKLTSALDSQNYITNHNALNMENLSQATKVAASQAAASGVAIDELTAAVGTMVATTQQGGDVAGRAFKGILMNLQQVKATADDIGDGGEDITTESLSKYEAAAKALGVSLKEVRNGVLQLRDPMEILRELSIAVQNEAEGSIKVANLISSVGGKFRGNQLIALLNNWETYEKMMSEYNSDNAVGSAMKEAEKSANNWSGSINQLKDSWAKLTNQFINSDNAISVVQSLNKVVKNLTESATTGTLKTLADGITNIIKLVGDLSDKFGAMPLLIGSILTVKGKGRPNRICLFTHRCDLCA